MCLLFGERVKLFRFSGLWFIWIGVFDVILCLLIVRFMCYNWFMLVVGVM